MGDVRHPCENGPFTRPTAECAVIPGNNLELPGSFWGESKLTKQAENEGVSINSLATAIIAEAIGAKMAR